MRRKELHVAGTQLESLRVLEEGLRVGKGSQDTQASWASVPQTPGGRTWGGYPDSEHLCDFQKAQFLWASASPSVNRVRLEPLHSVGLWLNELGEQVNALHGVVPSSGGWLRRGDWGVGGENSKGTHTGVFLIQVSIVLFQNVLRVADLFPDIHGLSGGRAARVIYCGEIPQPHMLALFPAVLQVTDKFPSPACRTRHISGSLCK